jgi:hypothetical protein
MAAEERLTISKALANPSLDAAGKFPESRLTITSAQ